MRNEKSIRKRIKAYESSLQTIKEDVFDKGRCGAYDWAIQYHLIEQLIKHLKWALGEINLPSEDEED